MRTRAWGGLTLLLLLALAGVGWWIANSGPSINLRWAWLWFVAVLVALCLLSGYLVNGRLDGILIDNRNRLSLDRVQWTAWLIVLLSGYFTETVWNIARGAEFPGMQAELYALLGIVSASPVASSLITNAKEQGPPPTSAGPAAHVRLPLARGDHPTQIGAMDANRTVADASWADLYLGEEVANRYVVDISRLQKLVITILLLVSYSSLLWRAFAPRTTAFEEMPPAGDTFVWLLGISHASYLAFKATPKQPS
jgi:hypothetical protein